MTRITTRTLACGMPLITETIPGVASVGVSWLIPAGTSTEPEGRRGLGALWSELLLRGAGSLDSRSQADAMDRLGIGRSTDLGGYHLRIAASLVGDNLLDALRLLADMVRRPRMDGESLEPARDLALQALESLKDDPHSRAVIAARARHMPGPYNRDSHGTAEGLAAITRDEIVGGWASRARPGGSILAIAGAIDAAGGPDAIARRLDELLAGWTGSAVEAPKGPPQARGYAHDADKTNQVQVVVVHDAPPEPHPDAILEKVVVSVLSGGMSARLFSEVREKRGLCYSVSASYSSGRDFGAVLSYVGTTPERAQESLDVLASELHRIHTPDGRVELDEFRRAVVGMKSRLVFSGESTSARAGALAADQHRIGRPRTLAELAGAVDAVTLDAVNAYLARRSPGRATVQTVGPAALNPPAL